MNKRNPRAATSTASLDFGPAHTQAILDAALDSVVIIDHNGLVLEFNQAAQATFGYSREEIVGRELADLVVPPEYREAHRRALARWTEEGPQPGAGALLGRRIDLEAMRSDGSVFPAELAIGRVDLPGPPVFTASIRDISDRRDAEARVRSTELRYRMLVERLPLSVYIDRLDEVSSNVYTSPQIESLLGYSVDEWVENRDLFVELLHPEDRERVLAAHQRTHATGEPLLIEYRLRTRDGRVVWVQDEARVVSDDGEPVLQGYLLDVTARMEAEEQLRHQAFHDALTGLANRALFADRVEHALVLRKEGTRGVAVLFLDLDDFKAVNDSLGHVAGDALLRGVGARLRDAQSPSHTVARLGGDEFAILIEEVAGVATAVDAAERLVAALQAPFDVEGREVFVTASVGIALGTVADELLRSADVAMYRAKAAGKAQYVVYAPNMGEELVGRLELVAELRRARCDEEFVLHYQPVVDLESGALVGVEALVRWAHPTRGLLEPAAFIPLAEETGKIVELGRWVLHEACRQVAAWRSETPRRRGALAERERLDSSGASWGAGRGRRVGARSVGTSTGCPDARAHGERARAEARGAPVRPRGGRCARCAPCSRRLRHRVLVAVPPAGSPGTHPQGRPLVRHGARQRSLAAGVRPGDRRPRGDARRLTRRRGDGDARSDDGAPSSRVPRRTGLPLRASARSRRAARAPVGGSVCEPRERARTSRLPRGSCLEPGRCARGARRYVDAAVFQTGPVSRDVPS